MPVGFNTPGAASSAADLGKFWEGFGDGVGKALGEIWGKVFGRCLEGFWDMFGIVLEGVER